MNSRLVPIMGLLACAAACSDDALAPRPESSEALTGIRFLAEGASDGFERAMEPRALVFPDDHGAHSGFRTEWWYFTGNLFAQDRRHFGFELTFFRIALAPEAPARASAWSTNEVWMAHFALTDTRAGEFVAAERLSRGALGLAGASAAPFHVSVEDWAVQERTDGRLELRAQTDDAAIALELTGLDRIVTQGDRGLDAKGPEPGNASYYYSAPRLGARGTITRGRSDAPTAVEGLAWMDREWGTSALSPGVAGWDWFALQLSNGSDLMYYRLRNADGTTSAYSGGTVTDRAGRTTRLDAADVQLRPVGEWRSRVTRVTYPVAWELDVPDAGLALEIAPRLPDQELDLSVRYWEGAVTVVGTSMGQEISGNGYLELAGY
jgi:predicted secreted hydrolase